MNAYEKMRLEDTVRSERARADEFARQACENQRGQYHEMQREYEAWREELAETEDALYVSATWSARWKALAKRQRKDLAVARLIIADLSETLGEQDGEGK
ncbi:MAG TPA: hypothetical protein VMW24_24980 [Sedimentisphaerales bacterium]|nr:hypothetical protein [Sedimentisphaerales bacterium]